MSAQLETLIERGIVQLFTANTPEGIPTVILSIANTSWVDGILVLATGSSVGNSVGSVGNSPTNSPANTPESVGNSVGNGEK